MITSERKLVIAAGWAFVVMGGWALLLPLARADDKKANPAAQAEETTAKRRLRVELRATATPVLARIPYVGRFLAVEQQCAEEDCERVGIDFECPAGVCPIGKLAQCHIICVAHPGAADAGECKVAQAAAEKCQPCAAGDCPACADDAKLTCDLKNCCVDQLQSCGTDKLKTCCSYRKVCCADGSCELCCTSPCKANCEEQVSEQLAKFAAFTDQLAKCGKIEVRQCSACEQESCDSHQVITELRVQNAILEAKLSAQQEVFKARVEILQQWAKLVADKTKIEAELAFSHQLAAEKEEVCQNILELRSEKHELEGMVRAAEERHAIEMERRELASENEKLKKRLAELEQKSNSPYGVAR